jgi:hypothetical protein
MSRYERHPARGVLLALGLAAAGLVLTVHATDHYLRLLPVDPAESIYMCRNCHVSESPTPSSSDLNPFGEDFRDAGFAWNAELAALNSDGDGCTNGVELGDSDGDGVLDGNVTRETGNPGVADDCGDGALTDPKTWGALKVLFQR